MAAVVVLCLLTALTLAQDMRVVRRPIAGSAPAGTPFITSFTIGTPRNDFDGYAGFLFTIGGSDVTVTHVGRWCISGNTDTHTVGIYTQASPPVAVITASINMSGCSAGTFTYASVTPTVLGSGLLYHCWSLEVDTGDEWYNEDNSSIVNTSVATISFSSYSVDLSAAFTSAAGVKAMVPCNFKY